VAQVKRGVADGEDLLESLVLDEAIVASVIGDVLDLLDERVVNAMARRRGRSRVGDHVLGGVAGRSGQLATQPAPGWPVMAATWSQYSRQVSCCHSVPLQCRAGIPPVPSRVGEDGADRLAGNRGVDIGPLSRYIHVIPPDPTILPSSQPTVQPACAVLHYVVVGRD
jgi:hypothetical protein